MQKITPMRGWTIALSAVLMGSLSSMAFAQQTIFNVPSADATEPGEFFFQHQSGLRTWKPDALWVQTDALGYGIGYNTEIDITAANIALPTHETESVGFGIKSAIPLYPAAKEIDLKLTVGAFIPVTLRDGDIGRWYYGHLSAHIPGPDTRISIGPSYGTKELFGRNVHSTMVGIEQPLTKKILFQADWFSGTHDLGGLIPGIVYTLDSGSMLSFGYLFPNNSESGNQALIFEYTTFFK